MADNTITLSPELAQALALEITKNMKNKELMEKYGGRITWQKTNRYRCNITLPGGKHKAIYGHTEQEVLEKIAAALNEKPEPELKPEPEFTLAKLYPQYRDGLIAEGRMATATRYDSDWRKYLADSELAAADIVTVKTSELKALLLNLIDKYDLTARKYRDIKTIVNGILDMAAEDDIIPANRARNIHRISRDRFRETKPGPEVYTEEESGVLCLVCLERYDRTQNPCYLALLLNFCINLRAGELVALKYQDFDFQAHVLHVCRQETKIHVYRDGAFHQDGVHVVPYLKAGHGERYEAIDAETTPALVEYIRKQCGGEEWLFVYRDGHRATVGALTKAMVLVNQEAGLEQRSNHKIRKTVLSRMIQSRQFSTTEIMERAGHRSYETTQKYYARPLPDSTQPERIADILPEIFEEVKKKITE